MEMPFHSQQLHFMVELTQHRSELLDYFFRFLNLFDTIYFVFVLVPFVWIGFSYRWGIRLFYALVINSIINFYLKELFGWPRPTADIPSIGMYQFHNFGFPSGGAQTAAFLGALLIHYWKNRYALLVGLSYIVLICFSRIYLGVHFPLDVLGGIIVGLTLYYLFVKTIGPIEKHFQSRGLLYSFVISEALPIILFAFTSINIYHRFDAIAVGLGIYLSLKYHLYLPPPKKISIGILRGVLAVLSIFLLYLPLKHLPSYLYAGIISLWLSLAASPACRKLRL